MESEDHPLIPQSRKRRTWSVIAWATVWLLALTACGTGDPPQGTVGFIVIEPGAVLLTAVGDAVQLRATVFDGAGNQVDVPVTWESAAPSVVGVDGAGLAVAAAGLGSSQIIARTGSLESPPLLVIVAPTVEGAVLVRDEQVVDGPVAVDDLADYGPGWRYAVTLAGVPALAPGDLLVGTGATPLGGRVVAVADASGGVRVTLEIVGLDELFTALEIDETLDLLHARPEFDDEVLAAYDVARHPDGSIEFVPRGAAASLVLPAQVTGVRALGVFDCTTTTTFPFSLPKAPQFTITPTVKMQLDYSLAAGLRKLGAEGAVKAEFKFEPKVSASFEGKLECEVELMAFPIPVGGPIALVIGGQVPIGVGFELKGKLVVAELGLDVNATGTATFGMGVTCPEGDCEPYATGSLTVDPKVTPKLPNVDEQLRLTFSIEPFAYTDLALGARSFKRLRIQLLRFTLGASQKIDLATATAQVADPAYASTFDLRALLKAKLGGDITRALALLKVTIKPLEVTLIDLLLAESPRGTFTIEPAMVAPTTAEADGDLATFTVTLSPTTYLGLEVIDRVEFRWQRNGALSEGRPACSVLAASPGQPTFSCTTDFLEEHEGLQTFYAFVYVKLFGIPLPIPLEINKDARATVEVILCQPTSTTPNALRPTSDHEQCTDPDDVIGPVATNVYLRSSRVHIYAGAFFVDGDSDSSEDILENVTDYSGALSASAAGKCDAGGGVTFSGSATSDVAASYSLRLGTETDLLQGFGGENHHTAENARYLLYGVDERWCGKYESFSILSLVFEVVGGDVLMHVMNEYDADPGPSVGGGFGRLIIIDAALKTNVVNIGPSAPASVTEKHVLSPGKYNVMTAGAFTDSTRVDGYGAQSVGHRFDISFTSLDKMTMR